MFSRILWVIRLCFLVLLFGFVAGAQPAKQGLDRYMGYKNPAKKKLMVMQFESQTLSIYANQLLTDQFKKELKNYSQFKIVDVNEKWLEEEAATQYDSDLDYLINLGKQLSVSYISNGNIELDNQQFTVHVEFIDVINRTIVYSSSKTCNCNFEELLLFTIPEMTKEFETKDLSIPTECPSDMISIAHETLQLGSTDAYDANPLHNSGTGRFCMDRYEFPNKVNEFPENNIPWFEAKKRCMDLGKRLCSEVEWELACRGTPLWKFPYGQNYDHRKCNTGTKKLGRSGSFPHCSSSHKIFDLSGNVTEWTDSRWDANIKNKVIRGGSWINKNKDTSCTLRVSSSPDIQSPVLGFRCCKSLAK